MRLGTLLSCIAAGPLLMAAAQPVRFQPSSPWGVDYAENSCRLVRTFGEGKNRIILNLESEAPGMVDMFVMGNPAASIDQEVYGRFLPVQQKPMKGETAQSSFGPVVLWHRISLLPDEMVEQYEKEEKEPAHQPGVRPPPIDLKQAAEVQAAHRQFAAQANELEVDVRRSRPLILETGPLGDPIKVFDQCSRDSLKDWGVDPDVEERIARQPWSPDVYKWFGPGDYPPDMARTGAESDVKVRLLVDATGKVTKCTSLSHFKEKEFNDVVCDKMMKRAHFEPAELADGTKVPSYYVNHIIFRIAR